MFLACSIAVLASFPKLLHGALLIVPGVAAAQVVEQSSHMTGTILPATFDSAENDVDVISAASEPPELFVEILSPISGDIVEAGSKVRAFGGPSWAIPDMEFYVDNTQTISSEDYNVEFEIDRSLTEGEHTFRVQFTCTLESCAGQLASASITLDVTPPADDPDVPVPPDPNIPDPSNPDPDDPQRVDQFSGSGCGISGPFGTRSGLAFIAVLGFIVLRRHPHPSSRCTK